MGSSIAQSLPDDHRSLRCWANDSSAVEGDTNNWRLDGALVTQFLYGDSLAFGRILEKHRSRIQKYCYRLLRSADKAEEATQEVFVRALEKLHTLRRAELLGAWLKAIALNLCLNLREREKACAAEIDIAKNVRCGQANPEQSLMARERQSFIAGLIFRLPLQQRSVVQMMYVDGLTYKEIEAATGLSNHEVKSCLQTARRRMRQEYRNHPFDCNFRQVYSRGTLSNGGRHHE